ncbi:DUF302 domain-containing protein [Shimia sp. MMG029]|uniref:DUF302 domain-containing protein n=1 Tax=Shimia sp. MMG029 TaxID=3021978 RepID=UPI0022FE1560|nr:DUF302 domain-containing protein [Shimia sp. MMG029]MDA5556975.1 DUF302 domain-containing protein [Shimia sp. MMG029]
MFFQNRTARLAATLWLLCGAAHAQSQALQQDVDTHIAQLQEGARNAGFLEVADIDHARLAAAEGVDMPPARALIYSDPKTNTSVLAENLRAGLDLPFRALSFAQDGGTHVIYTSAAFLKLRHGLENTATLKTIDATQTQVFRDLGAQPAPVTGLSKNYGIVELTSDLSVSDAVESLTKAIQAQSDTIWFGEIDYQAEAAALDVHINEAVLLLFGGPAPGGVAMADFPAIGLDAFCQKLLVYSDGGSGSVVLFNDIAALAEIHYGESSTPHRQLNNRLTKTFKGAL